MKQAPVLDQSLLLGRRPDAARTISPACYGTMVRTKAGIMLDQLRRRRRYHARRKAGLCWWCTSKRPSVGKTGLCKTHALRYKALMKKRRDSNRDAGKCRDCPSMIGADGTTWKCRPCADKDIERTHRASARRRAITKAPPRLQR